MKQLITNPVERLKVKLMLDQAKLRLAKSYFGNTKEARAGIDALEQVRKKFMGDYSKLKLTKAGGYYYYDLNTPGFPSEIFDNYYLSELNRIYRKYESRELKILLLAITKKCGLACEHCYEWDRINGEEVLDLPLLESTIDRFQERGAFQIQLGGGEPVLRLADMEEFIPKFKHKSDFMLVTSGHKLDLEKIRRFKKAGGRGVTISIDHFEAEKHDKFRGKPGSFDWAITATKAAVSEGLITGLSLCVTREFMGWDNLIRFADLGKHLGVGFIQILEPRAAGAYAGKDVELNKESKIKLSEFYETMNYGSSYSSYPIIMYHGYHQNRVGCVGAGGRFLYIDSNGDLKVCPFCEGSFGNIRETQLEESIQDMKKTGCSAYSLSEY